MNRKFALETNAPDTSAHNSYYMHISSVYRVWKWVLLLLFTVFLIIMTLSYRDSITYENFLYLTRNFTVFADGSTSFSSIVYPEQSNMSFAYFKGELAVAGTSEIAFYKGDGSVAYREDSECKKPILVSGDKYLLMYDEGGTAYSLYTPIGQVRKTSADSTIQCAALSDTGAYAIATRSGEARYKISLFNSAFRKVAEYFRDNYVTSLSINREGSLMAIAGILPDSAKLSGIITLCPIGSKDTKDVLLGERIPLYASYMENGSLAVVTDTALLLISPDGNILNEIQYQGMTLSSFDISDTRIILCCSENTLGTECRILLFDDRGNTLSDTAIADSIYSVTAADGNVAAYVQGQSSVYAVRPNGELTLFSSYIGQIHHICEIAGRAVFCFANGAKTAS